MKSPSQHETSAGDATARALPFCAQSSKIFEVPAQRGARGLPAPRTKIVNDALKDWEILRIPAIDIQV